MSKKLVTIVKSTTITEPLIDIVRRYSSGFIELPMGLGNCVKYGLYKDGNLILVSKSFPGFENLDYNSVLVISSGDGKESKKLSAKFYQRTGVSYKPAGVGLSRLMSVANELIYGVFERRGTGGMEELTRALNGVRNWGFG